MSARLPNRRIRLLVAVFAVVFAAALARATWLQAIEAPSLDKLAVNQQREVVKLPAHRGTIYDRMGVELAVGEKATTVYANPRQVRQPQHVADVVAQDLGLDRGHVASSLSDRSRGFVYLDRQADPDRAALLEQRHLQGIGFYPVERRVYPQRKVAAPVLGFAGVDDRGLAGLELQYDQALTGQDGRETIVRDPFGRMLDVVDTEPVREGKDVVLTIDHRLQAQVETVLRETRAEWGAKDASAIVLDPHTGEILALAEAPEFDANDYASEPTARVRLRPVTDAYEPGSTFKLVTVAATLQDGLVKPSTSFYIPDSIQVADRVIHDDAPHPPEMLTVAQILARSSNVGAVTLAEKLGKDRLARWIDRFGFGRKVGIDFPGESPGIVLPEDRWSGSTIGTVPIGQGIAVTPLQMAAAYATVANGGVWVQPHLAEKVAGHEAKAPRERRVVSGSTAKQVLTMMQDVVSEGTGTRARVPGYTVAGKTGTAEKPDPSGGYSDTRYVSSFIGIVPASAPRLVILVTVDEPKKQIFGGVVAAPAFAQIAKFALQYLDVAPDAPTSSSP